MADAMPAPTEHPLRALLNDEVHARPHLRIGTPARITHLAHLTGEMVAADLEHITALCRQAGAPLPGADARQVQLTLGDRLLKWERHTEFTAVTIAAPDPGDGHWSALTEALTAWTDTLPGQRLVAVHLRIEADAEPHHGPESLGRLFPSGDLVGSVINGGDALVWTDFRLAADGFTRFLVRDRALTPSRAGRLARRLLEVETYRMMALLGLPLAREAQPILAGLERRLDEIVSRTAAARSVEEEHQLLDGLTRLAAELEALNAHSRYRFGATAAYAELVDQRLTELREDPIPSLQRIGIFLERRFRPAVRTCEAMARRQIQLAQGVARASGLLRTRVDVHRAEQNVEIMRSLERRTATQIRIQEAVEGLSVFAISYYLLGLLKYVFEGLPGLGLHLPKEAFTALAVPLVLASVWLGVRRVRRALKPDEEH